MKKTNNRGSACITIDEVMCYRLVNYIIDICLEKRKDNLITISKLNFNIPLLMVFQFELVALSLTNIDFTGFFLTSNWLRDLLFVVLNLRITSFIGEPLYL